MTETLEVVDLCLPGLNCPMPVLRAKKALAKMAGGTLLRVVSTDRHSLADLAEFCRQTVRTLIKVPEASASGAFFHARPKRLSRKQID